MDNNTKIKILELIENGDELKVIEKTKNSDIFLDFIDEKSNSLLHYAVSKNMRKLAEEILKEDKSNALLFENQELNRIINHQNDEDRTALDLCISKDMKNFIKKNGGLTKEEIDIENEKMEDSYFSGMEDVSKIQTAHSTGKEMFQAIKQNDLEEFKRLYELNSTQGGLLIYRYTSKNKQGQSFKECAKILCREKILEYLKSQN